LRYVERAVLDGMREELKDPRLIEAYARSYNEERQYLAANSTSTRSKLEAKRSRIESQCQCNIDLVIKQIIGEDDARGRIAELKAQRLQVEAELAALEETPPVITRHPATPDRYIETVDALAAALADQAGAEDDRGSLVASFKGKLANLIGGEVFPQAIRMADTW
jgi:hypothetical protein